MCFKHESFHQKRPNFVHVHPISSELDSALCIWPRRPTLTLRPSSFSPAYSSFVAARRPSLLATQTLSHQQHSIIDLCQTRHTCHLSAALPLFHNRITAPFKSISFTALYHSLCLLGSAIHCGQPRVEHGARDRLRVGDGGGGSSGGGPFVGLVGIGFFPPLGERASERAASVGARTEAKSEELIRNSLTRRRAIWRRVSLHPQIAR